MTDKSYPATEAQKRTSDWNPMWDMLEEMDPDYLEAIQLTSIMGIHSMALAAPILQEEAERRAG